MIHILSFVMLAAAIQAAHPQVQGLPDARKLFDAGQYGELIQAVSASENALEDPRVRYLVARTRQKQGNNDEARQAYAALAGRDENDPWRYIGQSAEQLLSGNSEPALEAAAKAAKLGADVPEAHFQLGLAASHAGDFSRAASAFAKAGTLDPSDAYAQYYAGISQYKAKRVDQMAIHFERFLKLAPKAPERGEVESIMKTVRGR